MIFCVLHCVTVFHIFEKRFLNPLHCNIFVLYFDFSTSCLNGLRYLIFMKIFAKPLVYGALIILVVSLLGAGSSAKLEELRYRPEELAAKPAGIFRCGHVFFFASML